MSKNGTTSARPVREPFGQVAMRKGYVTEQQVQDALARQKDLVHHGAPHKLIGMIMLEMGALDTTELIDVLREMNVPGAPRTERRVAPGAQSRASSSPPSR
jgi:hypothetical protein